MNEQKINELLIKSKEAYEEYGEVNDIYDVLLNTTYEIVPFSKYVSVHNENKQEQLAKKLNMSIEEFKKKKHEADRNMYSKEFLGPLCSGNIPKQVEEKLENEVHQTWYFSGKYYLIYREHFKYDSHFMKLNLNASDDDYCIKLYFNIKPEKQEIANYFCDLIDLVKEEEINVYSKSRYDNSSDMVTFRLYGVEKLDKVIEFINKHKDSNQNSNPLISTYNGIGYTIDNGESYNKFLAKLLHSYVSNNEDISVESFKNFVVDKMVEDQASDLDEKETETKMIYYTNLNRALSGEEFKLEKFVEDFNSLNENNTKSIASVKVKK